VITVLRVVEDNNDRKILDSEITIFHLLDIIWLLNIDFFFLYIIILTALYNIT